MGRLSQAGRGWRRGIVWIGGLRKVPLRRQLVLRPEEGAGVREGRAEGRAWQVTCTARARARRPMRFRRTEKPSRGLEPKGAMRPAAPRRLGRQMLRDQCCQVQAVAMRGPSPGAVGSPGGLSAREDEQTSGAKTSLASGTKSKLGWGAGAVGGTGRTCY